MAASKQYGHISADGDARQHNGDYHNTATTNNYYNSENARQNLALLHTAQDGNLDRVKYLVEQRGMDVEFEDEDGLTALHCAVYTNSVTCVEYLLGKGAYIHHRSDVYGSPLTLAAFQAHFSLFRDSFTAINLKAKPSAFSGGLLGTLLHALFAGQIVRDYSARADRMDEDLIQAMIDYGTPMDAVLDVDLDFASLLAQDLSLCRRYSSKSGSRRMVTGTPLNLAVRIRDDGAVPALLRNLADVNSTETYVWPTGRVQNVTPLMRSCQYSKDFFRQRNFLNLLRHEDIDLGLHDSDGCNALMWAASNGADLHLELILKR